MRRWLALSAVLAAILALPALAANSSPQAKTPPTKQLTELLGARAYIEDVGMLAGKPWVGEYWVPKGQRKLLLDPDQSVAPDWFIRLCHPGSTKKKAAPKNAAS